MKPKDEIESLANEWSLINSDDTMETNSSLNKGYIAGYTQALEDNKENKYSEKDMIWAIQEAYGHGRDESDDVLWYQVEHSIQVILESLNKQ